MEDEKTWRNRMKKSGKREEEEEYTKEKLFLMFSFFYNIDFVIKINFTVC